MIPLLYSLVIVIAINIAAYIWAFKNQSDHITDFSYSASFIALGIWQYVAYSDKGIGATILLIMVLLWGFRLGGFLFYRIKAMGHDDRFNDFRGSWIGFLKFWILQSISIWIIALPFQLYFLFHYSSYFWIGGLIFFIGWLIESIADFKKFTFKQSKPNQFIDKGMYQYIRHPNYLGEILVWIGIFVFTMSAFDGWEITSVVSPLWVIVLLVKISGIPLLEDKWEKKYSSDPAFQHYYANTYRLIPGLY